MLKTKAVYKAQTGCVVAEEISDVLSEFGISGKIKAVTVDNAANMDVTIQIHGEVQTISSRKTSG